MKPSSRKIKLAIISILALTTVIAFQNFFQPGPITSRGINQVGMVTSGVTATGEDYKSQIDAMSAAGLHYLRILYQGDKPKDIVSSCTNETKSDQNFTRMLDVIEYAHRKRMKILLLISMTDCHFYSPKAEKRPQWPTAPRAGDQIFFAVHKISNLDLDRFQSRWTALVRALQNRKLNLDAVQFGNEINNSVFNGDLPMPMMTGGSGVMLNENNSNLYLEEMRRFTLSNQLISWAMRYARSSKTIGELKDTLFVGPSLTHMANWWVTRKGVSFVDPTYAFKQFQWSNFANLVDKYSMNVYPSVSRENSEVPNCKLEGGDSITAWQAYLCANSYLQRDITEIAKMARTPSLESGLSQQSFWITETGFSNLETDANKIADRDNDRTLLFQGLTRALVEFNLSNSVVLERVFVFNWDEPSSVVTNPQTGEKMPIWAIWKDNQVLHGAQQLINSLAP